MMPEPGLDRYSQIRNSVLQAMYAINPAVVSVCLVLFLLVCSAVCIHMCVEGARIIIRKIAAYIQARKGPHISYLFPDSGSLFGKHFVIYGVNLPENPRVFVGEKEAIVLYRRLAESIAITAPPSDTPGPVPVKIEGLETTVQYTYIEAELSVTKSTFNGKYIVVCGTGFQRHMLVLVDNKTYANFAIESEEDMIMSPPLAPQSTTMEVKLVTPGGSQSVTSTVEFPKSTIVSVIPSSGSLSGGKWIDVYGTGFFEGQCVVFNKFGSAEALATEFISSTKLRACVPATLQPGSAEVRLLGHTGSCQYTYVRPVVTDWCYEPSGENGGYTVFMIGQGFAKDDAVLVGPSQTEYISDTELRVRRPRFAGRSSSSAGETDSDIFTVKGTGFRKGAEVRIGSDYRTEFVSETELRLHLPSYADVDLFRQGPVTFGVQLKPLSDNEFGP